MLHILVVFATMAGAGFVLWGWGRLLGRCARVRSGSPGLDVGLGMAALLLAGGLLNCLHLAYAAALHLLILVGIASAAWTVWTANWRDLRGRLVAALLPAAMVGGVVTCFIAYRLAPPAVFNWHDDLERYFSYPVRMLATGTVGGNPLGYMGADTLGAQAFLQAVALAYLPIGYIGDVDWGFATLVCIVAVSTASGLRGRPLTAILAGMTVVVINPLVVNTSSVYTTACLVTVAIFLGANDDEHDSERLLLGVVYAGLLALKTTNVVFVVSHFIALLAGDVADSRSRAHWLRRALVLLAATTVCVMPWLGIHAPLYWSALRAPPSLAIAAGEPEPVRLFTGGGYFMPQLCYTVAALGALGTSIGVIWLTRAGLIAKSRASRALETAGLAIAANYLLLVVVFAPLVFGELTSMRYACAVFIGALPAMIALAAELSWKSKLRVPRLIPAVAAILLLVTFSPGLWFRLEQYAAARTPLAYLSPEAMAIVGRTYRPYLDAAFSGEQEKKLRAVQALVPPGEPIVAWSMTPFLFDYRRNPIFNTDPYGLGMPWARLPSARYFLWEYRGPTVRPKPIYEGMTHAPGAGDRIAGVRALDFLQVLEASAAAGEVLYNDGQIALWRTKSPNVANTAPAAHPARS